MIMESSKDYFTHDESLLGTNFAAINQNRWVLQNFVFEKPVTTNHCMVCLQNKHRQPIYSMRQHFYMFPLYPILHIIDSEIVHAKIRSTKLQKMAKTLSFRYVEAL